MRVKEFSDNLSRRIKRVRLEWQDLFFKSYVKLLAVAILLSGGGFLWLQHSQDISGFFYERAHRVSMAMGMEVEKIRVTGVRRMPQAGLRAILSKVEGASLPFLDIGGLRDEVESLGWVRSATVRRIYPDALRIRVTEHIPAALWQRQGRHYLITAEGLVISSAAGDFGDLLLLVGDGANLHLADLQEILSHSDFLRERFRAAVRVGERRWNIHLNGDVIVKLPEEDAASAWRRLGKLVRDELLLEYGDIAVLDMRLGDRLVIKFRDGGESVYSDAGA